METNIFAHIESLLQKPAADGVFVEFVDPYGDFVSTGIAAGDIIVEVNGEPSPTHEDFYKRMQPKSPDDKQRELTVLRDGKKMLKIKTPAATRGGFCQVAKGECAWEDKPDYKGEPDFSAFKDGVEYWSRNNFGDEPAGFQLVSVKHAGKRLQIDIDFRLGGDGEKAWEYFTRCHSVHNRDRTLSVVRTAFWEGKPAQCKGDIHLDDDGVWRGMRRTAEGKEESVETREVPSLIPAYPAMLLPMTMPLEKGACLTFYQSFDGRAYVSGRTRLECLGRSKTTVGGKDIDAWCFAWRHYGKRSENEDEKIYINERRELARVDWGENYSCCWTELLPKDKALEGIPKRVMS